MLTGAGGFFGSNVLDILSGADVEIHVIQRSPGAPRPGVTAHRADLLDTDDITTIMAKVKPTHLCHIAWLGPEHQDRYRSPENARWVTASKKLFHGFRDAGGERLVQVGSCIEYGNERTGVRIESQPLEPDTAYGAAKAELSHYVDVLGHDLSTAVARPFFSYGPHEQVERLVPSLILALDRGEPIDLTEGRQRRDYLDARDVARAIVTLLRSDHTGPYNIGSGVAVEVRAIAEHLGRISGRPELLNFGARPEGADTAAEIVADIGLITSVTDWRPTISLEQGLEEATEWWRNTGDGQPPAGGNS